MNFSLYLSDDLVTRLNTMAQATGKSRNALIRDAVEEWLKRQEHCPWPEVVLSFQGIPKLVSFERSRAELLPPKEPFDAVSA